MVNITGATSERLVDPEKIRELPVNKRDYVQLATLQPGLVITQDPRALGSSPRTGIGLAISISGGHPVRAGLNVVNCELAKGLLPAATLRPGIWSICGMSFAVHSRV